MINPDEIVGDEMSTGRLLEASKEPTDRERMKKFLKEPIFTSTGISLNNFRIVFEGSGLDPTKESDKSSITATSYQNFQKKL